ncbi:MAG: hypothetical protein NPIRA05_17180 [Nitrospirales bacterium]|nr:MAG: hypothetical protein NPIRA05_17180 [Nitrospirales bacterium]
MRFKVFGLKLRTLKCKFLRTKLKYLGYMVGHNTLSPDPDKAKQIAEIPTPTDLKTLRSFLGFAGWHLRRFAPQYPDMAASLSKLTRGADRKTKFSLLWTKEATDAFQRIKALCVEKLVNTAFDETRKDTTLWFDWSKDGIAAVLCQGEDIVRVWGRSCNKAEANYFPTKGEYLAFTEAQLKFRPYLLSLKHPFLAITDHRPLLGLDKKLEIDSTAIANMRTKTEEFRGLRNLVYVNGDKQLADYWSRIWPHKPLPPVEGNTSTLCNITKQDGDFKVTSEEEKDEILDRCQRNRIKILDDGDSFIVFTGGVWRTYIPKRVQRSLIYQAHVPDHAGEVEIRKRLFDKYWPTKLQDIKTFLRSCQCWRMKHHKQPRGESKESRKTSGVQAKAYLEIVQVDVYTYDEINYLTFRDVFNGRTWVKKLLKKGRGTKGEHKAKVNREYMLWESSLPRIPTRIHTDNEVALKAIPHPNMTQSPIHYPQGNSKIERIHQELSTLSRIHNSTPDKVVRYLKSNLDAGVDTKEVKQPGANDTPSVNITVYDENKDTRAKTYNGRTLQKGALVVCRIPGRTRAKKEAYWTEARKVTERIGLKTYHVYDGERIRAYNIDHLKEIDLGDKHIDQLSLGGKFITEVEEINGPLPDFDIQAKHGKPPLEQDWSNKIVWIGYPTMKFIEETTTKVLKRNFKTAWIVVPDLHFERWYNQLEQLDETRWAGSDYGQDNVWFDKHGHKAGNTVVSWWIIKITGKH